MSGRLNYLPEPAPWSLARIQEVDAERARRLENAGTSDGLVTGIAEALASATDTPGQCYLARERHSKNSYDGRALIQFAVGRDLFDRFFNARIGYRAHFYAHYKCGLRFNNRIVAACRNVLNQKLPEKIDGRLLAYPAQDLGPTSLQKSWLVASLEPYVSKVWWCHDRFRPDVGLEELETDQLGPRLMLNELDSWSAPVRDEDDAWLEIKGRFLASPRWAQGKKLLAVRAHGLHAHGTA